MKYLVSYDLRSGSYDAIDNELCDISETEVDPILQSQRIIESTLNEAEIGKRLLKVINKKMDSLVVNRISVSKAFIHDPEKTKTARLNKVLRQQRTPPKK